MFSEAVNNLRAADRFPTLCSKTPQAYITHSSDWNVERIFERYSQVEHISYLKAASSTFTG